MDFFQHQDAARRRTGLLVALFVLAVLCIIAAVYVVVAGFLFWQSEMEDPAMLWNPLMLGAVGGGVVLVVAGGSIYKIAQLNGGGEVVARSLSGRPVSADTTDPAERKLLNVVEEMALASGTPVPPVYLMDREGGINAFAAGWSPGDAVIGVTRGCVEQLSRDQLQGVIAHEFSHIFNGDMRTNIRLIGVIHGIIAIGIIGYFILRTALESSRYRSHRSKDKGGGTLALAALGGALIVIGFAGTFFGRLIKAAVSRQREFLADASAVQFTRNPDGIAGALQKIGGYTHGSRISDPKAEEVSHMFFGQGLSLGLLLATHPPLDRRIQRIDPSWDGRYPGVTPSTRQQQKPNLKLAEFQGRSSLAGLAGAEEGAAVGQGTPHATEQIGRPTPEHVGYAAELLGRIPQAVREAAREPHGAQAAVYALLLDRDEAIRRRQLQRLSQGGERPSYHALQRLLPQMSDFDAACRLPLVDLALPILRRLTPEQYRGFKADLEELIQADERTDLFEWALRRVVAHHLDPRFEGDLKPHVRYRKLRPLADRLSCLLSTLAYAGHRDAAAAEHAFAAGVRQLGFVDLPMAERADCGLRPVDEALEAVALASPGVKKRTLNACAACIATDAEVTIHEAELLRAIADSLDCPMPPLLPGQPLI